jgi:hypothetical protein
VRIELMDIYLGGVNDRTAIVFSILNTIREAFIALFMASRVTR